MTENEWLEQIASQLETNVDPLQVASQVRAARGKTFDAEQINAELLEALEMTERFFNAHANRISALCGPGFNPTCRTVRAAIAKAQDNG